MGRLEGKVALITGGARGQGASEASLFAAEGARVYVTDVLDAEGEKTATEIGGRYLRHDVTSAENWASVVDEVIAQAGRIDVLVNNAGIWLSGGILGSSLENYKRLVDVNQTGVFLGMVAVAKHMAQEGAGSIVNISSVAGLRGTTASAGYAASKWAVRGMTRMAARELGSHGIRVNSIHPGYVDTDMLRSLPWVEAGGLEPAVRQIPLGRLSEPIDVAKMALFLASDDSSYCSGSEFVVDGGWIA